MGSHVILNVTKIGFRRSEAAAFVGVSPTKFDQMVKAGDMPEPFRFDGVVIWRADQLVLAFNRLTGISGSKPLSAEEEWDKALGLN